jgi:hypothetical protein
MAEPISEADVLQLSVVGDARVAQADVLQLSVVETGIVICGLLHLTLVAYEQAGSSPQYNLINT